MESVKKTELYLIQRCKGKNDTDSPLVFGISCLSPKNYAMQKKVSMFSTYKIYITRLLKQIQRKQNKTMKRMKKKKEVKFTRSQALFELKI